MIWYLIHQFEEIKILNSSLDYRVSSRTVRPTQRNCLENKINKTKQNKTKISTKYRKQTNKIFRNFDSGEWKQRGAESEKYPKSLTIPATFCYLCAHVIISFSNILRVLGFLLLLLLLVTLKEKISQKGKEEVQIIYHSLLRKYTILDWGFQAEIFPFNFGSVQGKTFLLQY